VRHAARYYGAQALGITLSEPQAALARRRIREEGLEDRCRIEVRDYRDVEGDASFDRIVSVGMIEHVGKKRLPEYFGRAFRLLRPGGVFVNHGIVSLETVEGLSERFRRLLWRRGAFIDRYVFPDGELPTAAETLRAAEDAGFEMHDVEGLREHYALTLRQWVRRLERAWRQAEEMVGERTCRVWRLYMAASAHAFASGRLNLSQMVLARRDAHGRCDLPLTRRDLYPLPHASTVIAAD
jgi:cyclopropane-fatty-acyl-phospholipid synthase